MIEITVISLFVFAVLFVVFLTQAPDSKRDAKGEDDESRNPPDKAD